MAGVPEFFCALFERSVFVRQFGMQRLVQIYLGTSIKFQGTQISKQRMVCYVSAGHMRKVGVIRLITYLM
jgi:hypothetical protein